MDAPPGPPKKHPPLSLLWCGGGCFEMKKYNGIIVELYWNCNGVIVES